MRVAVIGSGTMGAGIAQVSAMAAHDVHLYDKDPTRGEAAGASRRASLDRLAAKGRLGDDSPDSVLGRVRLEPSIAAACDGTDVVIETVVERIEVKHSVFEEVLSSAPADALLGTNTSQLSITGIGSVLGDHAHRLIGMHFFNPPVLMRLVELVMGLSTSEEAVDRAVAFAQGLGKETVVCRKDSPGFMTSRVSAIVRLECLRMVEEGVGCPG